MAQGRLHFWRELRSKRKITAAVRKRIRQAREPSLPEPEPEPPPPKTTLTKAEKRQQKQAAPVHHQVVVQEALQVDEGM